MNEATFKIAIIAIAAAFTLAFCYLIIPPLIANPDIIDAFAAGFVNPYASGYSLDVFACWFILTAWITYEAKAHGIKHGWICVVLGVTPGVAVGFGVYLLMRIGQMKKSSN
jgi:hypothetical protein